MKELEIGDRLEFEDGRGATVLSKYPSDHYLDGGSPFNGCTNFDGTPRPSVPTTGYTLQWDIPKSGVITLCDGLVNGWWIDQEFLEKTDMRIVKKDEKLEK